MKNIYTKEIFEKAKKELKIKSDEYTFEIGSEGKKITFDGMNYFNEILSVEIYYNNTLLGEYNLDKKSLKRRINTMNADALEKYCDLVNNFVGFCKYSINYDFLKKYEEFKDSLDEGLSDREVMEMYKCMGGI